MSESGRRVRRPEYGGHHKGKKQYATREEAERACRLLGAAKRETFTAYQCDACGYWHRGHADRAGTLNNRLGSAPGTREKLAQLYNELKQEETQ